MRELFAGGLILFLSSVIIISGCNFSPGYPLLSHGSINAIVYTLNTHHGPRARYTQVNIRYENNSKLILHVAVSPERKKDSLLVRIYDKGKWTQLYSAAVNSLKDPPVFFTLDSGWYMRRIPELIRRSIEGVTANTGKSDFYVNEVSVFVPLGQKSADSLCFQIYLESPRNDYFEFTYSVKGELRRVDSVLATPDD